MKLSLIDLDALSNALEHSCQGALSPPDRDAALALVAEVRRRRAMPGWCALCRDPLADGHTHTASQWEEAALAQQVQPLTDGDLYGIISDAMCAASVGNNKPEARAIRAAVKALRDRMAQQAQLPYKCEKCGATFENWRCTKCMDRVRAQQAQPEMPTLEMIEAAVVEASAKWHAWKERSENVTFAEYIAAAVLALFAPKESECLRSSLSSRVCERGTKCCTVYHSGNR